MQYTFDEKEIQCFLNWAWPAECEIGLSDFEIELRNKLRKILFKTFDEMDNHEKILDFTSKCGYSYYSDGEFCYLCKEGKAEKRIPYNMEYKEAVKEIVNYFEV